MASSVLTTEWALALQRGQAALPAVKRQLAVQTAAGVDRHSECRRRISEDQRGAAGEDLGETVA